MINLENSNFKSTEELKSIAPSIFTTTPSKGVSEKYTHIPTSKIIEDMELLGWNVVDAKEVKSRKNIGFQKHLVVFRNNDVVINGEGGDTVYPQVLLTNSHDGKNAFSFTAGLFRMICENGLVISTEEFNKLSIRHMGYDFDTLQSTIKSIVEKLPLTVESMNKMVSTQLEQDKILSLAKDCLEVRFGAETKNLTFDLDKFIVPTRNEDEGDDLWRVFNNIQEKIIQGDFEYLAGSKNRKARKIKNFKQDMELNSKLFSVALSYVNA